MFRRSTTRLSVLVLCGTLLASVSAAMAAPLSGDYLGQDVPGDTPVPFAPGVLTAYAFAGTFSADLTEFYCTWQDVRGQGSRIVGYTLTSAGWQLLPRVPFVNQSEAIEPHLAPKGDRVFYTAVDTDGQWKAFESERTDAGWGAPRPLPAPINAPTHTPMYLSSTLDGTLYWTQLGSSGGNRTACRGTEHTRSWLPTRASSSTTSPRSAQAPFATSWSASASPTAAGRHRRRSQK
jgi:hypothetical protein